jgi:rhomboid protease GluP
MVTYALIAVNLAMFGLEGLWGGSTTQLTLFRMGANLGRDALFSEPWRLVSCAFLHIGRPHVLMNMWALYVLGSGLERMVGSTRFLAIYAASALGGGLGTVAMHERYLSAGASGAIWGLMVAQTTWLIRMQRRHGKDVVPGGLAQLAQPLIINVAISMLPGIDWAGHFGGGLVGGALGFFLPTVRSDDRKWQLWAVLGALLMAACVITAQITGQPWHPLDPRSLTE